MREIDAGRLPDNPILFISWIGEPDTLVPIESVPLTVIDTLLAGDDQEISFDLVWKHRIKTEDRIIADIDILSKPVTRALIPTGIQAEDFR